MDAGADLGEFMNGAAELLRALLMVQVGAEPEGLTEAMRGLLRQYKDELQPGDVLRMLRLLTDNETAIRRSTNSRLVVETLLLRWAMLDRIVDLEQVLRGGGAAPSGAPAPPARPRPTPELNSPPPSERRAAERETPLAPAAQETPRPASSGAPPAGPSASIPFALDAVQEAWPAVIAAVRAESRFLGEALAATKPTAVAPPDLRVAMAEPNPLLHERLEQQAGTVERIVSARVGAPVRLRIAVGEPVDAERESPASRMSESGIRAARLKGLRERDRALDAAADELDLEIVE
jgi:DNA polymerase-3 subunit gamma/tau